MPAPGHVRPERQPGNAAQHPGAEQIVTTGLIAVAAVLAVAMARLAWQRLGGQVRAVGLPGRADVIAVFDEAVPSAGTGYSY